jgi:hypothetical protein
MRRIVAIGMLALSGCGRMAFEPLTIGSTTGDAPLDAMPMIERVQMLNPAYQTAAGITAPMTLTADNTVIAVVYWNNAAATMSIGDSSNHMWSAVPRQSIPTGCHNNIGTNVQIFYTQITIGGATNIYAVQSTGAEPIGIFTVEYSGLSSFDTATGMIPQAASNTATGGVLTTTGFDVIVAGFHDSVGGGTMQPGAGLTTLAADTVSYALFTEAIGPAGAYNISATLPNGTSDACWVATAAAFHAR